MEINNTYYYICIKTKKPENGEDVIVLTNFDREIQAHYESFMGFDIWETDCTYSEDEKVIFWRKK